MSRDRVIKKCSIKSKIVSRLGKSGAEKTALSHPLRRAYVTY